MGIVQIHALDTPQTNHFHYLTSNIHQHCEIKEDVLSRIKVGWLEWRSASKILCDYKIVMMFVEWKFYRMTIRPTLVFGIYNEWKTKNDISKKKKMGSKNENAEMDDG